MRRDIGTDDPRVRVRAGKSSRPRTKKRPDWSQQPRGRVVAIDRGRYRVVLDDTTDHKAAGSPHSANSQALSRGSTMGTQVQAVRAKELGRGSIIMGDWVRVTGDVSGRHDTLARIVAVDERSSVLRRSLEDVPDQRGEKAIVANAQVMCIVVALADPPPRMGMIDRCLVAAYEAGLEPILCLTKSDLASPAPLIDAYSHFDIPIVVTHLGNEDNAGNEDEATSSGFQAGDGSGDVDHLRQQLTGRFCVLVGHSGVGKSTLINALVPQANRAVGAVNTVTGRGRHTSTSSEAFMLDGGGWIVDTPGVRSFGLGHVTVDDVLGVYPDVAQAASWCLPLCSHVESEPSCALDAWRLGTDPFEVDDAATLKYRSHRVHAVRRLLDAVATADAASKAAR
ncbi:ribosome small subunit-dependent GTPase A [Schaalia sp. ZJ405]|uniref:ribosome small subunit-dependent GTPase A n=1 Tax=Schaalia sp. ZJ405 TaxID=2709403 RepID=UPI0013EA3037|nr:ribosome small subunit-dependent GTPase A [Schaalia sp. ZJ405]QPK80726.1 ribosome small subunit-dependent GTPase A [Schaalia sp. ZJ405]